MREIIEHNVPNKEYKTNQFFIMGKGKQNQLAKIYSRFKEFSERKIEPKNMGDFLKKIKALNEIFKDSNTKFTPNTEIKDIIKEIDENTLSMKILKNNLRSLNQMLRNMMKQERILSEKKSR
ncbi:hypothetical protein HpMMM27_05000 [Helicobacter pylori]